MEMQKRRLGVSILEEDPLKPFVFRSSKDCRFSGTQKSTKTAIARSGRHQYLDIYISHIARYFNAPFAFWLLEN